MKRFFTSRSPLRPSPAQLTISYILLGIWSLVVLFPLYWLLITAFKLPIDVNSGPFYIPFVDFTPSLHAWQYILVELGNDTLRPFYNTIVVGSVSSVIALILGASASYALVRFQYRPRIGVILTFIGCIILAIIGINLGLSWSVAIISALAVFVLLWQTIGRRFKRALNNDDIAFWLISQRMLPPVAVVIPIFIFFQNLNMLDTQAALIITYVAINLPLVIWLMRDYFHNIPIELEECASIDGASRYRIFRSIILPLAVPGLVATFLFVLVFAWNEYLLALFLSRADTQTMPLLIVAQNATRGPQWWYMSVLTLIMIGPVILMAIALERFIARGILVGAVKG
ncbi:MAG: carbohydrate ABC transporter permease [Chloroflexota bacterium]